MTDEYGSARGSSASRPMGDSYRLRQEQRRPDARGRRRRRQADRARRLPRRRSGRAPASTRTARCSSSTSRSRASRFAIWGPWERGNLAEGDGPFFEGDVRQKVTSPSWNEGERPLRRAVCERRSLKRPVSRLDVHGQRLSLAGDAGLRAAEAATRRTQPIASGSTRHWGIENCIVCGTGRNAEYTPFRQRLSIKVARGGRERYFIDGRSIAVDDDCFLILNDNRIYGSRFESNVDIESFSIFFRPGIAEEVFGALGRHGRARARRRRGRAPAPGRIRRDPATARLRRHAGAALHAVRRQCPASMTPTGTRSSSSSCSSACFRITASSRSASQRLPALKSATQREIHRRLALAVDLVHSCYERDIGLAEMARAACLSKFHFLRLFTELHGLTPHAYLQRKRALAARAAAGAGRRSARPGRAAGSASIRARRWRGSCGAGRSTEGEGDASLSLEWCRPPDCV